MDDAVTATTIQTWSGGPFDLLKPRAEDINLLDIAQSLGKLNRFNGHSKFAYSVAQHSILVSMLLAETEYEREGLMHDAAEAYVGDIATPLKRALRSRLSPFEKDPLQEICEPIERLIADKFGLVYPWPIEVHNADREALRIERQYVMHPSSGVSWVGVGVSDRHCRIPPVDPETATAQFLETYQTLTLRVIPSGEKH